MKLSKKYIWSILALGLIIGVYSKKTREIGPPAELTSGNAIHLLKSTVRITYEEEISLPNMGVIGKRTGTGSGVILYSGQRKTTSYDPRFYTYILTCAHVVDSYQTVTIETFHYFDNNVIVATSRYTGQVIAKDEIKDMAIVEVLSAKKIEESAILLPPTQYYTRNIYESAYVVGCGLAKPPYITNGNICNLESDDEQLQITSATIFGNSGGGVFSASGQLLGIVRAISSAHGCPYPHAAFAVPIWTISLFLIDNHLGFILDSKSDLDQSLIDRKEAGVKQEILKTEKEKEEAEKEFRKQLLEALKSNTTSPINSNIPSTRKRYH